MTNNVSIDAWHLGATLYIPATHRHLDQVLAGTRLPELRSVVMCFEDAIHPDETPAALANLGQALDMFQPGNQLRFVRPRTPEILARILELPGSEKLTGAVLPKITPASFNAYRRVLEAHPTLWLMPTLETAEVFESFHMRDLRERMTEEKHRILTLRIGGNDLLHQLGMRRPKQHTIYDTPLASTICRLAQLFKPHGFSLSAPVFEYIDRMDLLEAEVAEDLRHGLTGKTAIHPSQVPIIEGAYGVNPQDEEAAAAIMDPDSPAVFRMHGAMCEPATHRRWAEQIIVRSALYGRTG